MTVVRIALVLIGMLIVIHGGQQPSLLGFVEGLLGTAVSVVGDGVGSSWGYVLPIRTIDAAVRSFAAGIAGGLVGGAGAGAGSSGTNTIYGGVAATIDF